MISKAISAAAITAAALSLGACSSSETSTLANGLIASATVTDKDHAGSGAKVGQSQGTAFTAVLHDANKIDVSWSTGRYSGKTRTFSADYSQDVLGAEAFTYTDEGSKEEGILFVGAGTSGGFALGAMHTIGKADAAVGATHFGEAPTNIPNSGTATYTVWHAGTTVNGGETGDQFDGHAGLSTITADFGSGEVSGTLKGLDKDITFDGWMSQGNAVYAANNADIHYGGSAVSSSSKLIGGFYGDGAATTAGVYDITALGDTPIRAIGGFYGDKQPP
jgi:hypothetical protein